MKPRPPLPAGSAATATVLVAYALLAALLTMSGGAFAGVQRPLEPGALFRDCPDCPEMIVVPAGAFTIGSPADEPGRRDDEGPQTRIEIPRAFAVGRFEVTRGEYEAFLKAANHPVSGNCVTDRVNPGHWAPDAKTNLRDPGYTQSDRHPVACVSWNDAEAYVHWLNARAGGGYRLLSEAEWEYTARAGSTTAYPWGDDIDDGCAYMNGFDLTARDAKGDLYAAEDIAVAACEDGWVNTAPVGSYKPNAFGLHDMIGNLAEWVDGCASPSYAAMRADGSDTGGDCARRMVRGGSWGTNARQVRSAERIRYKPTDVDDSIGIRVAKSLP